MQCESCCRAEATVHVTEALSGSMIERHLCSACADVPLSPPHGPLHPHHTAHRILDCLLATGISHGASLLRVAAGQRPALCLDGAMRSVRTHAFSREEVLVLLKAMATRAALEELEATGQAAFDYAAEEDVVFAISASASAETAQILLRRLHD